MMHEYSPSTVLGLPPEIIVKIFMKLPYTDIVSIRLTCRAFNDAGIVVQRTALHKMRNKADFALMRCHIGFQTIEDICTVWTPKGTASVKFLWGIIRVVDATTFHFILDGTLLPPPTGLLADVEKSLDLALNRNPVMGRDHLNRIFSGLKKYLSMAMDSLDSSLEAISVFRSTADLLASIPLRMCDIVQTPYGLHCLFHIPSCWVDSWPDAGHSHITAPILIQFLAKLCVKGVKEFAGINICNPFALNTRPMFPLCHLIELKIVCRPEDSVGVKFLEQICRLEPTDFQIRLYDVVSVPPDFPGNLDRTTLPILDGPLQRARSYTYCTSSSFSLPGLANNPVSKLE